MKANLEENKANKDQAHKSKTLSVDACNPCSSREDFFRAMDTNAANLPVVLSPPPRSFELVAERGRRGRGHGVRVRGGKVNKAPPPSTLPMEVDVPPSPGLSTELVASATNAQKGGRRGRGHGGRLMVILGQVYEILHSFWPQLRPPRCKRTRSRTRSWKGSWKGTWTRYCSYY